MAVERLAFVGKLLVSFTCRGRGRGVVLEFAGYPKQ